MFEMYCWKEKWDNRWWKTFIGYNNTSSRSGGVRTWGDHLQTEAVVLIFILSHILFSLSLVLKPRKRVHFWNVIILDALAVNVESALGQARPSTFFSGLWSSLALCNGTITVIKSRWLKPSSSCQVISMYRVAPGSPTHDLTLLRLDPRRSPLAR